MRFAIILILFIGKLGFADSSGDMDPNAEATSQVETRGPAESKDVDADLRRLNEAINAKDEQAVVNAATRVLGVDSTNLKALNALSVYYFNQGKFGLAKILIQRALHDHEDAPALHNNLGVVYLAEGKQKQAISSFRKALQIKSDYPFASGNLGAIYLEFKDFKRAAEALGIGYESSKSDLRRAKGQAFDLASNYAVALSGAGDLEKSKSIFQKLLKVDDQNPYTLYNYAVLLIARMQNKKDGEKILAKLKLVNDSSLQKKLDDLERMMNGS